MLKKRMQFVSLSFEEDPFDKASDPVRKFLSQLIAQPAHHPLARFEPFNLPAQFRFLVLLLELQLKDFFFQAAEIFYFFSHCFFPPKTFFVSEAG